MQVPVQIRPQRSGRRQAVLLSLGSLFLAIAMTAGYAWLGDVSSQAIVDRGGVPTPGATIANLNRIMREAWPRQSAARSAAPGLPHLAFNLTRRDIGKLATKRNEALRAGFLIQGDDDFVDADVRFHDEGRRGSAPAKIRLKGDFVDHIAGDKWSFRVRTKGESQILGMRVFSVQHPKVRGYAHEPLILEHMRREGVLAPRYRFARVSINGRDKGIMALEEHFSKELLESQERRESVIVRFDETLKWRTVALMGQQIDFSAPYPLITPFQSGKVAKNPLLQQAYNQAVSLMRAFLSKKLPPSHVFDPDKTARFLAVAELWGAEHALAWNNMRFYFNPITGLLEPIAFDCNLQDSAFRYIPTALVSVYRLADPITADWLEDPAIRTPFLRHLSRISRAHLSEDAWKPYTLREAALHQVLHQEFPLIGDVPFGFYRLRAMRLALVNGDNFRYLPLEFPNYPTLIHAFLHPSPAGFELELYNLVPYPVDVEQLVFEPASVQADRTTPLTLPPTVGKNAPEPTVLRLQTPEDVADIRVQVTTVIPGVPNSRKTQVPQPYSATATQAVLQKQDWETVLRIHGRYLRRNGRAAELGPGPIHIHQPLILPPGVGLRIAPGTSIRFDPEALILARGPVDIAGTATAPVELIPAADRWSGLAVLDAGKISRWTHVLVRGTSGLRLGAWAPTGSIMFYESQVELRNCRLVDNTAEDMLNVVRSEFLLENVAIEGCRSDAFDGDFCTGTVRNCTVRKVGGDGVDVSGSKIEIRGLVCEEIKDKAISAGERSTVDAADVHARNCGTGVASKDASQVTLANSKFEDMQFIALIAFMKKPEYGPGVIRADGITMTGTGARARAQRRSSIQVNGRIVTPEKLNVDALYRVGPMRKDGAATVPPTKAPR